MAKTEISKSGYKILKEKRLIIDVYTGNLNLESFIAHNTTRSVDVDYSKDYNLFIDVRSVTITSMLDDVDVYVDYVAEIGKWIGNRKTAVLVTTPNQTIYARQFVRLKDKLPQDLQIFTKMDDAVKFFTDELTGDELEEMIKDIRKDLSLVFYSESDY